MSPRPVHVVRFLSVPASAVQAMAFSPALRLLAVARANADVELWNCVGAAPFLQRWIPGNTEASVESLCWVEDSNDVGNVRLFSAGLHGFIVEYDLAKQTIVEGSTVACTGGPVWCMAYSPVRQMLAVGTEDGIVNLFRVERGSAPIYENVFSRQEGRILCIAWNFDGNFIATGSPDTVRVWNVDSGNPTSRMTTGRAERHKETIVWSVAFCGNDLKVMSGDSRGKTCFWNGRTGTLLDAYQTHKADVLTVAVAKPPSAAEAFSAGVDPLVVHFRPVPRKDGHDEKWVKSIHRVVHSHDVRAIVSAGKHVFSAGVDAMIAVTDMAARTVQKLPPLPHGQCVALAKQAEVLMLRQPKCIEVWRLGQATETALAELTLGSACPLSREPVKVLQLMSKDDETIRCCGVSDDAVWMAYACSTRFRVYAVSGVADGRPAVHRANLEANSDLDEVQLPHHIRFLRGEKKGKTKSAEPTWLMVTATEKGKLQVFSLDADSATPVATLKTTLDFTKTGASHLEVSESSPLCAAADFQGQVSVFDLSRNGQELARLPSYTRAPVVCLALSGAAGHEVVTTVHADHHVEQCQARNGKPSKLSAALQRLPKSWSKRKTCTRGLVPAATDSGETLLLYDQADVCVVSTERAASESPNKPPPSKSSKQHHNNDIEVEVPQELPVRFVHKYEHLVWLSTLPNNHLVAVEVRQEAIDSQLPPTLRQKKFGAM